MGAVGRTIGIVVVVVLVLLGLGYFLGPKEASRSQTLTVERPPQTVLARLSSAPVGTPVVEGVTIAGAPDALADASIGLHCYQMTFIHPVKQEALTITAALPDLDIWDAVRNISG